MSKLVQFHLFWPIVFIKSTEAVPVNAISLFYVSAWIIWRYFTWKMRFGNKLVWLCHVKVAEYLPFNWLGFFPLKCYHSGFSMLWCPHEDAAKKKKENTSGKQNLCFFHCVSFIAAVFYFISTHSFPDGVYAWSVYLMYTCCEGINN